MKDYTTVRRVIEKLVNDNYAGDLVLVFENTFLESVDVEHITIVDEGDVLVEPMEIGGSVTRNRGVVVLGIFTARGKGTEPARATAVELDAIFSLPQEGIKFGEREFRMIGSESEEDPLYQHNLLVPYDHFYGQEDSI